MEERQFIDGSRGAWERLATAVEQARANGISGLGVARLRVMHDDYRRTAADLAYSQTHYPGSPTTEYLNALVAQAHGELFGTRPERRGALRRFLFHGYPGLVRRHVASIGWAAGMLFGGAALGYVLAYVNYGLAGFFVPPVFLESVGDQAARGAPVETVAAIAPLLSAIITINNIQVSFFAFAGGMIFGVVTAYTLVRNGLMLGVLAALYAQAGLSLEFWSLIIPHGALELTAICVAGGAGLVLGKALLLPGDLTRTQAVRAVAKEAAMLVLGTIPMFVVAGLIEGFFTPISLDPVVKLVAGFGVLGIAVLYVVAGSRRTDSTEPLAP